MRRTWRVRDTKTPLSENPRQGFLNERRGSPNGVAVSAQSRKGKTNAKWRDEKPGDVA